MRTRTTSSQRQPSRLQQAARVPAWPPDARSNARPRTDRRLQHDQHERVVGMFTIAANTPAAGKGFTGMITAIVNSDGRTAPNYCPAPQ